jgi:hypothetical protein
MGRKKKRTMSKLINRWGFGRISASSLFLIAIAIAAVYAAPSNSGTVQSYNSEAAITSVTDSSTGTASNTIAAGTGVYSIQIPYLAATFANGDMATGIVIPHKFKITKIDSICTAAVTTGAKTATLNLEIGTTNLTGGSLVLDGTVTLGAYEAASAITAANTGAAGDTISLEAASVTTFVEGSFVIQIWIQNMDTADADASLAAKGEEVLDAMRAQDLIKE